MRPHREGGRWRCEVSAVGARINERLVPIHAPLRELPDEVELARQPRAKGRCAHGRDVHQTITGPLRSGGRAARIVAVVDGVLATRARTRRSWRCPSPRVGALLTTARQGEYPLRLAG